jgi:ssDNA-binding Zn-finger/Zn-ribbon topoisomerase 1
MGDMADFTIDQVINVWGEDPAEMYPDDPYFYEKSYLYHNKTNCPGNRCPRCNANLVERVNKSTGIHFVGCSSWPDCRYSASIDLNKK